MAGYIGSKASVVSSGVENKKVITATAGQTAFTGLTYSPNRVHVFQNGVRLVDGTDYTATDGNSLTLTVGAAANDQVVVVSYSGFTVGDVVPASTGGTFSNAVTIDADGSTVLTVDRATSDGTIIDLQKSGSSVGSIGSEVTDTTLQADLFVHARSTVGGTNLNSSRLWLLGGDSGIVLDGHTNAILPTDENSYEDARTNIGSDDYRFKDLYLSGGVYLGGTGSANKLSSYEEGSWTPTLATDGGGTFTYSSQVGIYTKIGNLCYIWGTISVSSVSSLSGGMFVTSLPFTSSSTTPVANVGILVDNMDSDRRTVTAQLASGGTTFRLIDASGGSVSHGAMNAARFSGNERVRFMFAYPV